MTRLQKVALVLALSQFFGFVAIAQSHFTFTQNTGNNATVGILLSAPSIAGAPLVAGDEIGAFTPSGLCVGAAVWDGVGNVAVTVWQDDAQTGGVDGITSGQVINYRLWRQSTNTEFSNPSVSYSLDPSGNGTYQTNGVYMVSSLSVAAGPASKYLVTSSSSSPVAGSTVTITAQLTDANNLPVATAGKIVTWSKTGAGGNFASGTSTTNGSGVATVVFTTGTLAGTVHTVTGTDNTSLTGTSANITTVVGVASKYLVTSSSYGPVAGANVTITAQLSDANDNPVPTSGKTVTWSKTGAGGSFGSPTSTTNGSGVATVVFTTGTVAGTVYAVTGTDNTSLTGTTANITTVADVASKYIVTSSSYGPVAGANVTITAQLTDANNNPVTTAGKVVTWSKTGAGGSFASPTSTTNGSGVATVVFTTGTVAGTVHTVTGTDNTSLTGTTANITTVVGVASKYVVTSSSYAPVAGANVTITVQLSDANNNPITTSGKTVTWSSTNGGTFGTPTSTTNASGIATVTFTTATVSGTVHAVTGTDNTSLTGTAPNITTVAGVATKYIVTSSNNSPIFGTAVTISAQLTDVNNNAVPTSGKTVTWSSTNGGSFASPTSTTNASGLATISFTTAGVVATVHTVTATDNDALTGTSASITTASGPPTKYLVTSSSYSPVAGSGITISAQLADNGGNAIKTAGKTVTWSKTGTGGSFASGTSTTDVNGIATVVFTTATSAGTVYTVTGTDNTSLTGTSSNITTVAGAASKYNVGANRYNPIAGDTVGIRAQLVDANNNPVTTAGLTVTWSKTGAGGSFASPTSTTDANGVVTVAFTTGTVAGTVHTVTATDATPLTGTSSNITNIAGPATKYLVTSSGYGPVAGSAVTITAQLSDANNNPVSTSGKTVTWSKTGAGGSFASGTSTTNGSGIATVVFTSGTVAGTMYAVTGTDNTSLTGTAPNITSVVGVASKYVVGANRYNPVAGDTVGIVAQLTDANGNPVATAGKVVTWSKTGTGGSFGTTTSTTDANGVATVAFTTGTVSGMVYAVTGTDNNSLAGTAPNITTVPGPGTKYIVTSSNNSPIFGTAVTISAQLTDVNNNAVPTSGKTVTWSSTNGGSFASPTSTTNASGLATISFTTAGTVATVHTVTATDNDALTGTSASITTASGPPTKYTLSVSRTSPVAGDTVTIAAQLSDAGDHPIKTAGRVVTWTKAGTGGSFASGTSTTDANGIAMVVFTTGTVAGKTYSVTGTDNLSMTGTSPSFWTIVGPPAKYLVTASRYNPQAGDTVTVYAQLADVNNNPWPSSTGLAKFGLNAQSSIRAPRTVTWSNSGAGGSFSSPTSVVDTSGRASVIFTTGLVPGVAYTFAATDNASLAGSSSTVMSPPSAAILVAPADSAEVITPETFRWTSATGATSYRLQIATSSSFAGLEFDATGTDTSMVVSSVSAGADLYWRVSAVNAGGATPSSIRRFHTPAPPPPLVVPSEPVLMVPADGSTNITLSPLLIWRQSTGADVYILQVCSDSLFTVGVYSDSTLTATSARIGPLKANTTFYWRVAAKNVKGKSPFSGAFRFTTIPAIASVPILIAPSDSARGISISPTLSWHSVTGAKTYEVEVSVNSAFAPAIFSDTTITDTTKAIGPLGRDTTYFWHVRARSETGSSAYSVTRSFTTVPSVPRMPVLLSPIDTSNRVSINPTLVWNKLSSAKTYWLQVAVDTTFRSFVFSDSTLTDTTKLIGPLGKDSTFFWRVNAKNETGTGPFSALGVFKTLSASPSVPSLVLPLSAAQGVSTTPLLVWNKSRYAKTYWLQVAADSAFIRTVFSDSTLVDTTKQVGPLGRDSSYYWRVSAKNDAGTSAFSTSWSFRTLPQVVLAPALVSPLDSATGVSVNPSFVWHPVAGAKNYLLQVSLSASFATTVLSDSTLVDTTAQVGPLQSDTTYFWRVSGKNAAGSGPFSGSRSFKTSAQGPAQPTLAAPATGTVGVAVNPTLTWNAAARATTYGLQVSTSSSFATTIVSQTGITATSFSVAGLANNTLYYWRVNSTNPNGTSSWSIVSTFTTVVVPPAPPTATTPANGATAVAVSPALSWTASVGAVSYGCQVSTSSTFATTVIDQNGITGTSLTANGLTYGTSYYWRVNATNGGGTSGWSATSSFTTIIAAPPAPTLIAPANGAVGVALNPSVSWTSSAGAVSFTCQVSTNASFTTTIINRSGLTGTSYVTTGLAGNTVYYWRMSATNEGGTSGWSTVFSFTTAGISAVERYDSELPIQYGLRQNYPNPFNPSTIILFAIPKSSDVVLKIYDVLGKEVSALVSQQLPAGNYSVRWNGASQPGGIYFYRLQAGDFSETKRLVLLK